MKKKSVSIKVLLLVFTLLLSTFSIAIVGATEDSWTTRASMPTARCEVEVAVVDGKLYAIGGSNGTRLDANEMYDPNTDTWTIKASMPTPRARVGLAVFKNKIYVIGGSTWTSEFLKVNEVYDPLTDTWETKTPMPSYRNGFATSIVDGKIYLIGGCESPYDPWPTSNLNQVYDPSTDSWTTRKTIPTPVSNPASAVVDNKIYVIGGREISSNTIYNLTQIYDPQTDTWSYGTPIPTAIYNAAAGATTGEMAPKKIYVIGGYTSSGVTNQTQVYDLEADLWSSGKPMPSPRASMGLAVINDTFYTIGGRFGDDFLGVNIQYTPIGYIPEFPTWTPIFLTLVVLAMTLGIYKRRLQKTQNY